MITPSARDVGKLCRLLCGSSLIVIEHSTKPDDGESPVPLGAQSQRALKADNVASGILPGLRELNIQPKAVEEIVPTISVGRLAETDSGVSVGALHAVPIRRICNWYGAAYVDGSKVLRNISPRSVAKSDGS